MGLTSSNALITIADGAGAAAAQATGATAYLTPGNVWTFALRNVDGLATAEIALSSDNATLDKVRLQWARGQVNAMTVTAPVAPSLTSYSVSVSDGESATAYVTGRISALGAPYVQETPATRGFIEWNENPSMCVGTGIMAVSALNMNRLVALVGGTISNILVSVGTLGSGFTAATTATITGAANNGAGLVRMTAVAHGYTSGDIVTQAAIVGTSEAIGAFAITVIDADHYDLRSTTFVNPWVSGGTATRSANCAAIYDSTGALVGATGDQAAVWNTTGVKVMALAKAVTLTPGAVYYVVLLFNGTASTLAFRIFGQAVTANAGITGAAMRWSTNGTGTKLPTSFTLASNAITSTSSIWVALS